MLYLFLGKNICCERIFLFLLLSIMFDPHQNSWRKLKRNIKWTRSRVWHWLKTPTTRTYKTYLNLNLNQNFHRLTKPTIRTYKTYQCKTKQTKVKLIKENSTEKDTSRKNLHQVKTIHNSRYSLFPKHDDCPICHFLRNLLYTQP